MVLQLILMTLVISSCFAFLQKGLNDAPPLFFGAIRTFSAGTFLTMFLLLRKKSMKLSVSQFKWLIPLSLFSTTFTFGTMFESSQYTSTGIGTLLANAQPLMLMILGIIVFHERLTRQRIAVLLLGLLGIIVISIEQIDGAIGSFTGIVFALVTSLSSTIGSLIAKKANPGEQLLPLTAWQLLVGSLPLFIFSTVLEEKAVQWTLSFLSVLLYLSLIGTVFTVVLWFRLLQQYDVSQLSPYLFLTPIFGFMISFLILGETLAIMEFLGILLILIGLFWEMMIPRQQNVP